ncbi:hypothetical protein Tco_0772877 [Tanacetum coccineum]|uniref:Uncharacterized protein n=1 Tax=Tanacetum coccineum TaxID=301880 RepID=A0ABQ4ZLR2_9ASTR
MTCFMEMIDEELHLKKPNSHVDPVSDVETNHPLDDVAHVIEQFEHENKGNVNIPSMTTDDPWLNKLVGNGTFIRQTDNPNPNLQGRFLLEVEDPDDEQVGSKFKAKQDVSYPSFNPEHLEMSANHCILPRRVVKLLEVLQNSAIIIHFPSALLRAALYFVAGLQWCLKATRGLAWHLGIVFVAVASQFLTLCMASESDAWLGTTSRHRVCSHHVSGHHRIMFAAFASQVMRYQVGEKKVVGDEIQKEVDGRLKMREYSM